MLTAPMRILIVEDQPLLLAKLSQQLQADGHEVLEASSALHAMRLWEARQPDLVLLDVLLPDDTGYALARRIRQSETGSWTPIIFLSSLTGEDDLQQGIAAGGDDYLTQPVLPLVLKAKLHAMQRLLHARQALERSTEALRLANAQLSHQSTHDALTGLGNRRGFDERLAEYVAHARREQKPLTLLLCDVDFFKRYNDRLGHLEGDTCLRHIAQILKQVCRRPLDYAARYGGEEFALILPGTPAEGGLTFAIALHHHLGRHSLFHPDSAVAGHVTLSGGLVSLQPSALTTPEELIRLADEALYAAKSRGRNRFVNLLTGADTGEMSARSDDLRAPTRVA